MRKPRMTKAEKTWVDVNFKYFKSGMLCEKDNQKYLLLITTKTR